MFYKVMGKTANEPDRQHLGHERPRQIGPVADHTAIGDAEFAVAENGAFLTHGEDFKFRSLYFLAQHLIVRIKKSRILNNMHEAYAELGKMKTGSFTGFISGPSKTADIEQCLVIGAHGARSLQVLIVED